MVASCVVAQASLADAKTALSVDRAYHGGWFGRAETEVFCFHSPISRVDLKVTEKHGGAFKAGAYIAHRDSRCVKVRWYADIGKRVAFRLVVHFD